MELFDKVDINKPKKFDFLSILLREPQRDYIKDMFIIEAEIKSPFTV